MTLQVKLKINFPNHLRKNSEKQNRQKMTISGKNGKKEIKTINFLRFGKGLITKRQMSVMPKTDFLLHVQHITVV